MNRPTFQQLDPLFAQYPAISITNLVTCINKARAKCDSYAIYRFAEMIDDEPDKLREQGWTNQQLSVFFTHCDYKPA